MKRATIVLVAVLLVSGASLAGPDVPNLLITGGDEDLCGVVGHAVDCRQGTECKTICVCYHAGSHPDYPDRDVNDTATPFFCVSTVQSCVEVYPLHCQ